MKLPVAKKINFEKYEPGLSLFNNKKAKIKLSANESALGPSPKAVKEYKKAAKAFGRYPDSDGKELKQVLSKKFKIESSRIILGSGSDQIFELICKTFIKKNDEIIVPKYSFIVYRIYGKINGAKIIYANEKNFTASIDNILLCVTKKTKIVFLANPNNPTGTYLNKKDIVLLRKKLRSDILLVIDDAYFEYVKKKDFQSGLNLFSKSNNVIVTRTFSKIYGLAGLRIGWGYASKNIINSLNLIKPPFNVNNPALSTACAATIDISWLKKEIQHVNKWRNIMFKSFKEMKINTNKGNTNFILINFNRVKINSINVFKRLAKNGILVRKMETYKIKNSLRITIGKTEENKKFLLNLKKILNV